GPFDRLAVGILDRAGNSAGSLSRGRHRERHRQHREEKGSPHGRILQQNERRSRGQAGRRSASLSRYISASATRIAWDSVSALSSTAATPTLSPMSGGKLDASRSCANAAFNSSAFTAPSSAVHGRSRRNSSPPQRIT